jgi:hypothetical protein
MHAGHSWRARSNELTIAQPFQQVTYQRSSVAPS